MKQNIKSHLVYHEISVLLNTSKQKLKTKNAMF